MPSISTNECPFPRLETFQRISQLIPDFFQCIQTIYRLIRRQYLFPFRIESLFDWLLVVAAVEEEVLME
jgi:hypothetical protein